MNSYSNQYKRNLDKQNQDKYNLYKRNPDKQDLDKLKYSPLE